MFTREILIDGNPGYLHAKVMVADGNRAWLGSVNGSNAATSNNREFGVFFNNAAWVQALDAQITADRNAAGAESWQQSLSCEKD
jgi:phosphatidylserine/phosphatidylglycerophosphate/cardiolipin synthase-like enzyme